MFSVYQNGFKVRSQIEYNNFVREIIRLGELYIRFLISKNQLYLPPHLNPEDVANDLLGEIFPLEKNILIRFRDYFENNTDGNIICDEEEFQNRIRAFIYKVIRNNLPNLYKEADPVTFSIYRNIKEAVKSLGYYTTLHFSDKYIHADENILSEKLSPDKDELLELIYREYIAKDVLNIKVFLEKVITALCKSDKYAPAVKRAELVSAIKTLLASEQRIHYESDADRENISNKLNLKFILNETRYTFSEKLNKYVVKNNLPKNFSESMYNIIDEVINDFNEGNQRASVKELMKTHFGNSDKNTFNKVQYCIEIFENELIAKLNKENELIG